MGTIAIASINVAGIADTVADNSDCTVGGINYNVLPHDHHLQYHLHLHQ